MSSRHNKGGQGSNKVSALPRYSQNLGILGIDGQRKLLSCKIIVAGLGGLGGHVLDISARLGIGTIAGIDHDVFDETNLNRQLLSDEPSVGQPKALVAAAHARAINSHINFIPIKEKLENVNEKLFKGAHLVFDCLDNPSSRILLQNIATRNNLPLVHGAIGGWYGQVAVVWPGNNVINTIYGSMSKGVENKLGNPSFTPPVAAGIMVSEGVKVLLGKNVGANLFIFFDLLEDEFNLLKF